MYSDEEFESDNNKNKTPENKQKINVNISFDDEEVDEDNDNLFNHSIEQNNYKKQVIKDDNNLPFETYSNKQTEIEVKDNFHGHNLIIPHEKEIIAGNNDHEEIVQNISNNGKRLF